MCVCVYAKSDCRRCYLWSGHLDGQTAGALSGEVPGLMGKHYPWRMAGWRKGVDVRHKSKF